jgi:hypothetical protein
MAIDRDKEVDLMKLADRFMEELFFYNGGGYGAPTIDTKRPFGSSCGIEGDILEIIGWEQIDSDRDYSGYKEQQQYAADLYREDLVPFLKQKWKELKRPSISVEDLKEKYGRLQASIRGDGKAPLDNSLNKYVGLAEHAEMFLTRKGTIYDTGTHELQGTSAEEYVDIVVNGARPEERDMVLAKLKKRLGMFKY